MKTAIFSVILLAALGHLAVAQTNITCLSDSITVISTAFNGQYVRILNQTCTAVQLSGGPPQTAVLSNATCETPEFNKTFTLAFTTSNSSEAVTGITTIDAICTMQSEYNLTFNATFQIPAATVTIPGALTAGFTQVAIPASTLVGGPVSYSIALDAASQANFRMMINRFTITAGDVTVTLVEDGCPTNDPLVTSTSLTLVPTPVGADPTSVTINYNAFIPQTSSLNTGTYSVDNKLNLTVTVLTMTVTVKLCDVNNVGDCWNATGCPGNTLQIGRRKRSVDPETTRTMSADVVVFTQEESRQAFLDNMRQELGITDATRIASKNDLCINRASSAVIIVIFIVVLFFCFIVTLVMFYKLRKSRRLHRSDKSHLAYSNSSY